MTQTDRDAENGRDREKDREKEQRGVKRPIVPAAVPEPIQEVTNSIHSQIRNIKLEKRNKKHSMIPTLSLAPLIVTAKLCTIFFCLFFNNKNEIIIISILLVTIDLMFVRMLVKT